MNENQNQIGVTAEVATVTNKVRGRKRNPACTREIRIDANGKPLGKGAPKVGSTVLVAVVQRSVKNADYVHGETPATINEIVIGARSPRKPKQVTVTVNQPEPAPVEAVEVKQTATQPVVA